MKGCKTLTMHNPFPRSIHHLHKICLTASCHISSRCTATTLCITLHRTHATPHGVALHHITPCYTIIMPHLTPHLLMPHGLTPYCHMTSCPATTVQHAYTVLTPTHHEPNTIDVQNDRRSHTLLPPWPFSGPEETSCLSTRPWSQRTRSRGVSNPRT